MEVMYAVRKKFKLSARHSKDGKAHNQSKYYAGSDRLCGFGVDNWIDKKSKARLWAEYHNAARYARSLGGEVVEVKVS